MSKTPKVHIDSSDTDLPEFDEETPCHECGGTNSLKTGFGLAGGGFGPYTYCLMCKVVVTKSTDDGD